MNIDVEYVDKLHPIFTKSKRIKIIVGGRGSTKSTGVADYVTARISQGELWCCAREQLNSIEESVHRTILDEISRLDFPGFDDTKTSISHTSGGRNFYRGLNRNITSLKSTLSGIDGLWIEEGEDLTANTLRVLTASVRLNAEDTQRAIDGEDVKMPEIIITMNRGARNDPMSTKYLARAESELERCGYYEDDLMMVVELNYTDMPEEWFLMSGLEQERSDDYEVMSRAEYDHKWLGKYNDGIENAIIKAEWFDSAIDSHIKLGFKPRGQKILSHDPSDSGDAKAYALRHGNVILGAEENTRDDVNDGCDWALDIAIKSNVDVFRWDYGGLGVSLKRQVNDSLDGKPIKWDTFNGASTCEDPNSIYEHVDGGTMYQNKLNKDIFRNLRAQCYWRLRDRFYLTYRAVVKKDREIPVEKLISISSDIDCLQKMRSELCRIPLVNSGTGLIQVMDKAQMKAKLKIESPNLGDSVMMSEANPMKVVKDFLKPIEYNTKGII